MNSKINPIWYHVDPIMVLILYFDVFWISFRDTFWTKVPWESSRSRVSGESFYIFSLCASVCVQVFTSGSPLKILVKQTWKCATWKQNLLPHPQISFHDNLVKKTFCQLIKRGKGIESRQGYSINAKNGRYITVGYFPQNQSWHTHDSVTYLWKCDIFLKVWHTLESVTFP